MKFSKKFEEDYQFYLNNLDKQFLRNIFKLPIYCKDGLSAKEVFYLYDSRGVLKSCKDVELFKSLINIKKNINLQIKMWVEGYIVCGIPINEYLNCFKGQIPVWVKKSLVNQINKKYKLAHLPTI